MPYSPSSGWMASTSSRRASLPALRRSSISPSRTTATPAESYPRYSSRRRPSMRIGRTCLSPMYPMIPHIVKTPEARGAMRASRPFLLTPPARFVALLAARDPERAGWDVSDDRRSRRDVGTLTHADGRHELGVAADERAILDNRRVLLRPVVIAGDRAGAHIHLLADRRIAEGG